MRREKAGKGKRIDLGKGGKEGREVQRWGEEIGKQWMGNWNEKKDKESGKRRKKRRERRK